MGLTQKQLAKELDVDETTIHNWETNHTFPVVRLVPVIIQFLGYVPYAPCESFPERLRMRRRELGLSQKKLAMLLDVDETSVGNWESGRRTPSSRCQKTLETFLKDEI